VLPYQRHEHSVNFEKNNRWILKMHGCVHHKEDIVLTREVWDLFLFFVLALWILFFLSLIFNYSQSGLSPLPIATRCTGRYVEILYLLVFVYQILEMKFSSLLLLLETHSLGIVQAQMFTKHMLFVGFSLVDPNFNTIADTVRDSIPHDPTKPERYIGSSIQLRENKRMQHFRLCGNMRVCLLLCFCLFVFSRLIS
jgi:hypothetical protein